MREIHSHKTVRDGKREFKVRLFRNEAEMTAGMNACLDAIANIRRLIEGLEYEVFENSRPIQDQCAINFLVIGNQMGKLDDSLKSNRAMETAYGARNRIAHWYGTPIYRTETLWDDLNSDLDCLEKGCLEVLAEIESGNIVIVDNKKRRPGRGWFGHRSIRTVGQRGIPCGCQY